MQVGGPVTVAHALETAREVLQQARPLGGGHEPHEAVGRRCGQVVGQVVGAHPPGGHQVVGQQCEPTRVYPVGAAYGQDRGHLAVQFRMGELDACFRLTGEPRQQPLSPELGSEREHRDAVPTGHRLCHHDGALPFELHYL